MYLASLHTSVLVREPTSDLDLSSGWLDIIFARVCLVLHQLKDHMVGFSVDYATESCQDLTSLTGVLFAIWAVLQLGSDGILWACPECCTWLSFVSRSTYQKFGANNFEGAPRTAAAQNNAKKANVCAFVTRTPLLALIGSRIVAGSLTQCVDHW